MWALNESLSLPRSKKSFTVLSKKGVPIFIKPGKMMYMDKNSWHQVQNLGSLYGKITQIAVSPSGRYVIELPKVSPLLALHDTKVDALLLNIPLPNIKGEKEEDTNLVTRTLPDGTQINCANPFQRVEDLHYVFNAQDKPVTDFATLVQSFVVSDSGKIAAVLLEDNVMVWQQLDDQYRGVGFWTNLSANQHFPVGFHSPDPKSIKIHKYISVFDNPDEGRGACFVTAVLPPSKPFDTIYLFNSVCNFNHTYHLTFSRYSITLPVTDGYAMPRMWWSPCGKVLVVAVAKNVVMLTREMNLISVIPLNEIFSSDDTEVAMIAWSSSMQFFVLTTFTGLVGAITRSGVSLKHKICNMSPFDRQKHVPLGVYADSDLSNVFIVYSREKYRHLKIDQSLITKGIDNILSLPYPNKLTVKSLPEAKKIIKEIEDTGSIKDFALMLFYTDLYRIFPEFSPLRYDILEVIKTFTDSLLKSQQNDCLCFFLVRAVLRITGEAIPALHEVMRLLSLSKDRKDRLLLRVLDEELQKKDYVIKKVEQSNAIKFYETTEEDDIEATIYAPPHHNKEVDVHKCITFIKNLLFNREFDSIENVDVDLTVVMEMMIELGKLTRALQIAQHPSIESNPTKVYSRIVSLHATEPIIIYKTMIMCIPLDYNNEFEIRAICLTALLNIMRQAIVDTAPDMEKRDEMAISDLCMIEEGIDIPIPEREEECSDFGVVTALCFCTAGFQNVSYFFNGKSKMIPSVIREQVREIFRLLWFVRWRHNAFQEAIHSGKPGDATLRLLEFPEFVDVESTRALIEHCDESFFTQDIFQHYITERACFELDPDFVDFACECAARVTQSGIDKVGKAVLSFTNEEEEVIESTMLLAAVVSHLLPWLRVSIPIAMVGLDTTPIVPNSLLAMEHYSFPREAKPEKVIEKPKSVIIEPIVETPALIDNLLEEEDEEEDSVIQPFVDNMIKKLPIAMPPPSEDYLSEGEEDLRPRKSKPKDKDKEKDKKKDKKGKEKEKNKKKEKERKREKPRLRLIDVEDKEPAVHPRIVAIPGPALVPSIPPTPEEMANYGYPLRPPETRPPGPGYGIPMLGDALPPYVPSVYMPALHNQGPAYGPIWDMDPSLFERPFPKPAPNIPMEHPHEMPKYTSSSVQANVPPQNTRFIMVSKNKEHQFDSSGISDLSLESSTEKYPSIDPFPFDDELQRRVERLLNNQNENIIRPMKPKYEPDEPVRGN